MPGHLNNNRLQDFAAGRVKLLEIEVEHLHACELCQGVLYLFLGQPPNSPEPESTEAA